MAMVGIRNQHGADSASRLDVAGEVQTTIAGACEKAFNMGRVISAFQSVGGSLLLITDERSLAICRTRTKQTSVHAFCFEFDDVVTLRIHNPRIWHQDKVIRNHNVKIIA